MQVVSENDDVIETPESAFKVMIRFMDGNEGGNGESMSTKKNQIINHIFSNKYLRIHMHISINGKFAL